MHTAKTKRIVTTALTLTLALSQLPAIALASENDGLCQHHPAHNDDCSDSADSVCVFVEKDCPQCRKEEELITIVGTDVTIDGHQFPYTGQPICPEVTVMVNGQRLEENVHYSVHCENNVEPGSASVTVTGMEEAGFQGIVTIVFTITQAPEETLPTETQPEESTPEESTPEESKPGETVPEETTPAEYSISKGNGATWYQNSGKHLTFTLNADTQNVTGIQINGKNVKKEFYSLSGQTVVVNKALLNTLTVGTYPIFIHFADGSAEGTFVVSDQLDTTNPVTGDRQVLLLWFSCACAAMGGILIALHRKRS
ncbi:MAG: hypothetical protein J6V25_13030 [Oscillospiraceae bacterium]|nr:hypothetical protein [Oscillospiraceae bacterium]